MFSIFANFHKQKDNITVDDKILEFLKDIYHPSINNSEIENNSKSNDCKSKNNNKLDDYTKNEYYKMVTDVISIIVEKQNR